MKKLVKLLFPVLLVLFLIVNVPKAYADEAPISIALSGGGSVTAGQSVTITMSASSGYNANGYITYDPNVLSCSEGSGSIPYFVDENGNVNIGSGGNSVTFTTSSAGSTAIGVSVESAVSMSSGEEVGHNATGTSVSVVAPTEASVSHDASLTGLTTSLGAVDPAAGSWTLNCDSNVTTFAINPSVAAYASWSASGDFNNLQEGENHFTITVTAQDGTTQNTYYITVVRAKAPETSSTAESSTQESTTEKESETEKEEKFVPVELWNGETLYAGADLPEEMPDGYNAGTYTYGENEIPAAKAENGTVLFYLTDETGKNGSWYLYDEESKLCYPFVRTSTASTRYTVLPIPENLDMPEGYTEDTLTIGEKEVTVWKKDGSDDMYLVYAVTDTGEKALYRYDAAKGTFLRYEADAASAELVKDEASGEDIDAIQESYQKLADQYDSDMKRHKLINILLLILAALAVAAAIYFYHRSKNGGGPNGPSALFTRKPDSGDDNDPDDAGEESEPLDKSELESLEEAEAEVMGETYPGSAAAFGAALAAGAAVIAETSDGEASEAEAYGAVPVQAEEYADAEQEFVPADEQEVPAEEIPETYADADIAASAQNEVEDAAVLGSAAAAAAARTVSDKDDEDDEDFLNALFGGNEEITYDGPDELSSEAPEMNEEIPEETQAAEVETMNASGEDPYQMDPAEESSTQEDIMDDDEAALAGILMGTSAIIAEATADDEPQETGEEAAEDAQDVTAEEASAETTEEEPIEEPVIEAPLFALPEEEEPEEMEPIELGPEAAGIQVEEAEEDDNTFADLEAGLAEFTAAEVSADTGMTLPQAESQTAEQVEETEDVEEDEMSEDEKEPEEDSADESELSDEEPEESEGMEESTAEASAESAEQASEPAKVKLMKPEELYGGSIVDGVNIEEDIDSFFKRSMDTNRTSPKKKAAQPKQSAEAAAEAVSGTASDAKDVAREAVQKAAETAVPEQTAKSTFEDSFEVIDL